MITELERKFYNTFGIEPEIYYDYKTVIQNVTKTGYWFDKEYLIKMFNDNQKFKVIKVIKNINYPEITAEKLLEMICVLNKEAVYGYSDWGGNFVIGETVEELKKSILTDCIRNKSKVFKQIQQLFKEEKGIIDSNV